MIESPELERLLEPVDELPEIAGIGGELKSIPADFVVEEIPLYEPEGEGGHAFLWVEKTDIAAFELIDQLASTFGVDRRDIGVAGQKDKRAITRQYVSIPVADDDSLDRFLESTIEGVTILKATRHPKKLKRGHLSGNRFEIRLRDVRHAPEDVDEITKFIAGNGVANRFGPQRFGNNRSTFWAGYQTLSTDEAPKRLRKNKRLRGLALNAVQSAIFNAIANERIRRGILRQTVPGDIVQTSDGLVRITDDDRATAVNALLAANEASVLGPLHGSRLLEVTDEALELEQAYLDAFELTESSFAESRYKRSIRGIRRPFVLKVDEVQHIWHETPEGHDLTVSFSLPSGSYATVVLEYFMKPKS